MSYQRFDQLIATGICNLWLEFVAAMNKLFNPENLAEKSDIL